MYNPNTHGTSKNSDKLLEQNVMKRSLDLLLEGLKHNHRFDAGFRIFGSDNDAQCFCPFSKPMAFFHKLFNINEDIDYFIPCN